MPTTVNPNMAYYLAIWGEMLSTFLGWSDEQVMQWARQTGKLEFMNDPEDIFYHETPQYWIKDLLVPAGLRGRLTVAELIDLEGRILAAFADEHHYEFPVGTDWRPYREKIECILREYGASLDRQGA
jgi:hypothetical protein